MQDLRQSMIDCLKRRHVQIESKLKALVPPMPTPVSSRSSAVISKSQDQTYDVPQHQITFSGNSSSAYNFPVKLDFPCLGYGQDEDPIVFIECCEEYFAVRPLNDCETMAALTSVLKGTAKDWWQAEKRMCMDVDNLRRYFFVHFLVRIMRMWHHVSCWRENKGKHKGLCISLPCAKMETEDVWKGYSTGNSLKL